MVVHRINIDTKNYPSIKVNNEIISFSSTIKNLGIVVNKTLTWDDHIKTTISKLYFMLRSLWALTKFATMELRRKLFLTYVFPHLIYGDIVFYGMQDYNLKKLEKAFNAGIRYVFRLRKYDHISRYINSIVGCSLKEYYEFRVCFLIFRLLKFGSPVYLAQKLQESKSVRTKKLLIPVNNFDIFNSSFYVRGICLWNTLPLNVRTSESCSSFKRQVLHNI